MVTINFFENGWKNVGHTFFPWRKKGEMQIPLCHFLLGIQKMSKSVKNSQNMIDND